jgi:hypothetical protein
MNRLEERLAPLDGIAAVILWVAGVAVLQGPGHQPHADASGARALQFFQVHTGTVLAGTSLFALGTLFFLWFVGLIRAQLGPAEGGTRRVSSIAYAGGIAMAISLLLVSAAQAAGAINNVNLSPDAAQVYLGASAGFYYAAGLAGAVFLLATGLTSLGTGAFPVWLGWASIGLAVWLLIVPIAWIALVYVFPLWLIAVSVLLWTRSRSGSRPDPAHRTP